MKVIGNTFSTLCGHFPTIESLKLQITHCTGLAQADRFGLSDPLCIVKWPGNDDELGRTPTIYNTVHPVWKACFFELPLSAPTAAAGAASSTGEGSPQTAVRRRTGRGSGSAGGEEGEPEDETLELTVQVWDEDDGDAAEFLGELQFDAQALLNMARGRRHLVRFLAEFNLGWLASVWTLLALSRRLLDIYLKISDSIVYGKDVEM